MPTLDRREGKYSSLTGIIFLFNLIVGTGALALPSALQKAGWLMGGVLLIVLALFSFITVTFILESLSISNALIRKRNGSGDIFEDKSIEETPLVPQSDYQENLYEITEKYEIGQMGVLMTPKWCQILIYICLCVYLYGDLSIYAVVIGQTCSQVLCTYKSNSSDNMSEDIPCWMDQGLTKINFYRLSVVAFIVLMGPFVFFNLQKTRLLQIVTSVLRWLAFFIMIAWSVFKLSTTGKKGDPPAANFKSLSTVFGTIVYSFMCQHSIPGLLQPISNKKHLKAVIGIDFVLVSVFYLILSLTAMFTFQKLQDIYTLNFWLESSEPDSTFFLKILSYYLALFPVFTLSTNFPIIAITLRNNLRCMILKDTPVRWYYDKFLFPIITILLPTTLALSISNIQFLLGIIGSYAGACVQYLIPCILVLYARSEAREFNTVNIYASPFSCKAWIYAVCIWMIIILILISINYAINIH